MLLGPCAAARTGYRSRKRDLADAIVGANEGLMRNLGSEDLELLLS
jgi:hypothetical protein